MIKDEVKITRIFNAPIEQVWNAWVNPENLEQWLSPEGMTTPHASSDLNVNGTYAISMQGGHAGNKILTVRGMYKTIERHKKLVFSWKWDGQDEDTLVTLSFKKLSKNKTELILIHSGFETQESQKEHNFGWKSTFNKLEIFAERR